MMKNKIYDMRIINNNEGSKSSVELLRKDGDVYFYKFTYSQENESKPEAVRVEWLIDSVDVFSTWHPMTRFNRALRTIYTAGINNDTRYNFGAPVQTLISKEGQNRGTIAVSDAVSPMRITTQIYEPTMQITCRVIFFTEADRSLKNYETIIRVDLSDIPYYKALQGVEKWWNEDCSYKTAHMPEAAKKLFYSTWYSYHTDMEENEILEQCKLAKEMGMEGIIVDDGWGNPYPEYTLNEEKIADMKVFVDKIHETGLKAMLWFSIPFMDKESVMMNSFGEFVMNNNEKLNRYILDTRYKEVREYQINKYETAVRDWGFDGLKLDFVDSIQLSEYSMREDDRRDYDSVYEATHQMMLETASRLKAINPEVMIEYRQAYIGPAARMSGNILRVSDCPNDALYNRVGAIDLRLVSGKTTVHSDMIGWHLEDTKEECARQLIASLFCVPQISVKIEELNNEHKAVLKFFCDMWNKYRDVLLNGELIPLEPEANYTQVIAKKDDTEVIGCYGKNSITLDNNITKHLIVNDTNDEFVVLYNNENEYRASLKTYNCIGEVHGEIDMNIEKGMNIIPVSICGMVEIETI